MFGSRVGSVSGDGKGMKLLLHAMLLCIVLLLVVDGNEPMAREAIPDKHPEELKKGNPMCTECHDPESGAIVFKRYNHTLYFMENHRHEASQGTEICAMCHKQRFCNDCHATRIEMKPSIKNQSDTYRRTPHRGDYLARHRIDGRIDPTSCIRCHGNPKTARQCIRCHG